MALNALDPMFTTLINDLMTIERQPLTRLTQRRDTINVQKGMYTDLKGMLDDLQSATKALISTDAFYSLSPGRSVSVTNTASGQTVLSASAGSTAAPGNYDISVTSLAREMRVRSIRQTSTSESLGLTGTFSISAAQSRSQVSAAVSPAVSAFSAADVIPGQSELASGDYFVETRNDAMEGWQFRVVDSNGAPVSVLTTDGSTNSSDWQSIPAGSQYNTGRGLKVTFAADSGSYTETTYDAGAAKSTYTAQDAAQNISINVEAGDSLADIASKINNAAFDEDARVFASIIDNHLVLSNSQTGAAQKIAVSDTSGSVLQTLGILNAQGGFANMLQNSSDAVFTVNSLSVTRTSNTSLTDVISGITLNLAGDAEGKSATLQVKAEATSERKAIDTFIQKFNKLMESLSAKVSTIKQDDGTYKRGALAGDSMFVNLRYDLVRAFNGSMANSGTLSMLTEIGLGVKDSFQLEISSSSKLEDALLSNRTNVVALMDAVMGKINTMLDRYTGSTGYLKSTTSMLESQLKDTNSRITDMNLRLAARQEALVEQYGQVQAQLMSMTYMQQQMSAVYSNMSWSG